MNTQQLRVVEFLADASLGQGVRTVRVMTLEELGEAVWLGKKEIGQTIAELLKLQVIKAIGATEWELETDLEQWKAPDHFPTIWRWRNEADRERGMRRQMMIFRDQGPALVVEDRGLGGPERTWRDDSQSQIANTPKGAPNLPEDPAELRRKIRESLDGAGKSPASPVVVGGGQVAHRNCENGQKQWVSHPPELPKSRVLVGESPTVPVGESPTEPRAHAHARPVVPLDQMETALHWNQCSDVAPKSTGVAPVGALPRWRVDDDLMRRIRLVVGEVNSGFWWKVLEADRQLGQRCAMEALGDFQLGGSMVPEKALANMAAKGTAPAKYTSVYLFGIYRRIREPIRAETR